MSRETRVVLVVLCSLLLGYVAGWGIGYMDGWRACMIRQGELMEGD